MKAIVRAVKQERRALLKQLKLVEVTLARFGATTTRRKRRKSAGKRKAKGAAAAPKKAGKKKVVEKKETIEERRERARMARQERPAVTE